MNRPNLLIAVILSALLAPSVVMAADNEICRAPDGYLDRGIGGTAMLTPDDKGIGGTGVTTPVYVEGRVYAFGSLCVNGLRISYNDDTKISASAAPAKPADFQVGQVVRVLAVPVPGSQTLHAQAVDVVYTLQGPIDQVDVDHKRIQVLGTSVTPPEDYDLSTLKAGMPVRVSGLGNPDGSLEASLIVVKPDTLPDEVTGLVKMADHHRVMIGNTPVVIPASVKLPAKGGQVTAQGKWSGDVLQVSAVLPAAVAAHENDLISIEGYVQVPPVKGIAHIADHPVIGGANYKLTHGELLIMGGKMGAHGIVHCENVHELPDDDEDPNK
jgi:hypothetical protein